MHWKIDDSPKCLLGNFAIVSQNLTGVKSCKSGLQICLVLKKTQHIGKPKQIC